MNESALPLSPRVAVILLAGGRGARAGCARPKQLELLGGRTVLAWSLDAFAAYPRISRGVLVGDGDVMAAAAPLPDGWISAEPGPERQQSVANALAMLADWEDGAIVLVHDAARPGVGPEVIDRLLDALGNADAAIPTLPVPDTLVEQAGGVAGDVAARDRLARVQTPQAFRLGALRRAHAGASGASATDDAQLVRQTGVAVATVAGDARLHKLTYAEDMAMLAGLLGTGTMMRTAVGMGYDVHRLVEGKPLWIGGIEIEHSHGLEGHSDADVALHALTDAIASKGEKAVRCGAGRRRHRRPFPARRSAMARRRIAPLSRLCWRSRRSERRTDRAPRPDYHRRRAPNRPAPRRNSRADCRNPCDSGRTG